MCFSGSGGSGIGGILGGLAGGALDIFGFPEAGVPLALATAGGAELGGTLGGVASGENLGKAAVSSLPEAAISGAVGGLGELGATGNFLGAPGDATTGPLGGLLGGAPGTQVAGVPTVSDSATAPPVNLTSATGPATAPITSGLPAQGAAPGAGGTITGGTGATVPSSTIGDPTGSGITPTVAATDTGGGGNFLSGIGTKALNFAENNPLPLLSAGGIGASLLLNNTPPGLSTLQNQAGLLSTQGSQALNALNAGQLPAGAQAALDQADQAAKATVASRFGAMGLTGSTQEAQAEAGIDQAGAAQKYQDLLSLSQTGLQEVGAANSLYSTIMNTVIAQNANVQKAIANIAAALGGAKLNTA
jgi:hypothetical protein